MAMITTASRSVWPLDVPITQLDSAGLTSPSIIRMKIFTLDHRLVLKTIGHLSVTDQIRVQQNLQNLLHLNAGITDDSGNG
jgi:mRNA interferase MazF